MADHRRAPVDAATREQLLAPSRQILEDLEVVADECGAQYASATLARSDGGRGRSFSDIDVLRRQSFVPFTIRIEAVDEESGKQTTIYVSRLGSAKGKHAPVVNYLAPLGRLAEAEPGEVIEVPLPHRPGKKVLREFLVELAMRFEPQKSTGVWDAIQVQVLLRKARRLQIASLRRLVQTVVDTTPVAEDTDALRAQRALDELEIERTQPNVVEGWRRRVVEQMRLRDQPILDRHQGRVFRMPLNARLFLSGPPGTGKTTTLIKRVAQKSSLEFLSEDERPGDQALARELFSPTDANWVMFTPTDLLKLYLKEAFADERIAASETQVRTWVYERERLGRDVLGILRSGKGGRFVLARSHAVLAAETSHSVGALLHAFDSWHTHRVRGNVQAAIAELGRYADSRVSSAVKPLGTLVDRASGLGGVLAHFERFEELRATWQIQDARVKELSRRDVLTALRTRMDATLEAVQAEARRRAKPGETAEEDDDESGAGARSTVSAPPMELFRRELEKLARAVARDGGPPRAADERWLMDLLGELTPALERLAELGRALVARRQLAVLAFPARTLVHGVPAEFARFRRTPQARGHYDEDALARMGEDRISGAELDVLVALMLERARSVLSRRRAGAGQDPAGLGAVRNQWRTQVLVDEATDFSVVQLRAMWMLSHPQYASFFCAGDFHQRVTVCGIRSKADLDDVATDFEVESIRMGYRQSARLRDFTMQLATILESAPPDVDSSHFVDYADVGPLLIEDISAEDAAAWVSARIEEIDRALGATPSIAVFVASEEQVESFASMLGRHLGDQNLRATACRDGRDVGRDQEVRVFDIAHVKGLEFEAVFFVGVDEIAVREPHLFDRLLYVGATRAATYLGITCVGALPTRLEPLRGYFVQETWVR